MFGFGEKVTPRQGFIDVCLSMSAIDMFIDPRESKKIVEVLTRYGFSLDEIEKEFDRISKLNTLQAFRNGMKAGGAIKGLDTTMRKNLIQALTEIAEADEKIENAEELLLKSVKSTLGM